jgi:hypothetical protein
MIVSWSAFTLAFTILFLSMRAVIGVGGYCAEGGPYVIETHCPGNTAWMTPISIYLGLGAVALYLLVARGLGASLLLIAWPVLFIGLSINFIESGLDPESMGITGLALGGMFFIMGAIPLVAWLRRPSNLFAAIAGTSHLDGTSAGSVSFQFGRSSGQESAETLTATDYVVLVPLWLLSALFGIWVGVLWFNS